MKKYLLVAALAAATLVSSGCCKREAPITTVRYIQVPCAPVQQPVCPPPATACVPATVIRTH